MNRFHPLFSLLLLIALLSSCRTQNLFQANSKQARPSVPANPSSSVNKAGVDTSFFTINADYEYIIRKDDKISVSIWDHDDLSVGSLYGIYNSNEVYGKWLMVNARGEINVPKIGAFRIRGLSIVQAQDSLKKRYAEWVKNPIVEVKVLNKEITVMGELKSPGKFLVDKDYNPLIEMIAKAGDFDFYADKRHVKVIRLVQNEVKEITIDLTRMENYTNKNILLLPGDVVYVPSKKGKDFDKRIATIIPFASIATAFAITYGTFF